MNKHHNHMPKTPYSVLESSDTKFCSESKRAPEKNTKLERNKDILSNAKKNISSKFDYKIESTNKKLNFNAIDEESNDLNNNNNNNNSPKKIDFDVFNDNGCEINSSEENNSSRDYHYFEVHGKINSQKSRRSDKSDKFIDNMKIKTDIQDESDNNIPDPNFISPKIEGKHRSRIEDNVFDYESARRRQSFEYSDNECQGTPAKRNTRSSKNKDLLSPVTRVLGLDSNSKIMRKLAYSCEIKRHKSKINGAQDNSQEILNDSSESVLEQDQIAKKLEYISEEDTITESQSKIPSEFSDSEVSENTKWKKYGINKVKNCEILNLGHDRLYVLDSNTESSIQKTSQEEMKITTIGKTKNKCKALSKRILPLTDKFETDYTSIELIGSGNFGQVFKAK